MSGINQIVLLLSLPLIIGAIVFIWLKIEDFLMWLEFGPSPEKEITYTREEQKEFDRKVGKPSEHEKDYCPPDGTEESMSTTQFLGFWVGLNEGKTKVWKDGKLVDKED